MLTPTPADLLAPFAAIDFSHGPVVAALSGGSDSSALLVLLKTCLDRDRKRPRIVAVTVDHGLRPESHAEATAAAALAARLGVEHRIVRWAGPRPHTGLPAAARLARYGLLAQTAREVGASMILTGHTADDQAETVAMRRVRGAGPGLAGMATATLFEGAVWIVRPLLSTRRLALRDFLAGRQIAWSDDPGNDDRSYERARVRAALSGEANDGNTIEGLLRLARQVAAERRRLGAAAASLIADHADRPAPGLIRLAPAFLRADVLEPAIHALRILASVTGGSGHLPDERRTRALLARLSDGPHRATLSRAVIASRRDGVWLCRERRGLPDAERAVDGMVWDGRCRLIGDDRSTAIVQTSGMDVAVPSLDRALPASLARTARFCRPVFRGDAGKTWPNEGEGQSAMSTIPAEGRTGWSVEPVLAPWATFLPGFDLVPAAAVARLIGALVPPDPPCADIIDTRA